MKNVKEGTALLNEESVIEIGDKVVASNKEALLKANAVPIHIKMLSDWGEAEVMDKRKREKGGYSLTIVWDKDEQCSRLQTAEVNLQPVKKKIKRALVEQDPNGKAPNEAGAKLDQGKIRPHLVLGAFANALVEVSKVGTFGANKYSDNGWLSVPDGQQRYSEALLRHYLIEQTGETIDPDSGLLHAAHFAWNALARLELQLREEDKSKHEHL